MDARIVLAAVMEYARVCRTFAGLFGAEAALDNLATFIAHVGMAWEIEQDYLLTETDAEEAAKIVLVKLEDREALEAAWTAKFKDAPLSCGHTLAEHEAMQAEAEAVEQSEALVTVFPDGTSQVQYPEGDDNVIPFPTGPAGYL